MSEYVVTASTRLAQVLRHLRETGRQKSALKAQDWDAGHSACFDMAPHVWENPDCQVQKECPAFGQ